MHIYLVRHADALSHQEDEKRPLSRRGRQEAALVSHFLKKKSLAPVDEVWHSTRLRAKQTAEIFVKELGWNVLLKETAGLEPDDGVDEIAGRLGTTQKSIMVVGQMAYLEHMESTIIVARENPYKIKYDLAAVLSLFPDRGK